MRVFCFFTLGVFLLVMQTTLLQLLPSWLGRPDLVFILVVFLAYRLDLFRGALLAFLLGLIMDIFSGIFLGLYPIIYLLVFFLLKWTSRYIAVTESVYQAPMAAFCYLLSSSGIFVVSCLLASDNPPEWSWGAVLLQILLLAVIGIPCFAVFDFMLGLLSCKVILTRFFKSKRRNRFLS